MDRRTFLQRASVGALALSTPASFPSWATHRMGIVVHSYWSRWNSKADSKKYPGFTNAIQLLDHCHQLGGGGVQVLVNGWTTEFAKKVRDEREKLGLYVEGSIGLPKKAEDVATFEQDVLHAKEAGANVLRTVCSSGRRYETYHTEQAFEEMKKGAFASLRLAEPVLRKHKVKLGIENHKDFLAPELVALLKQVNSEWIGVTLDFGNSMALLEDPMDVVQTLAPYTFSTHVKDMAVEAYQDGFLLSEVPLGQGVLDLKKMVDLCKQHNPSGTFSLEMITRDPLEIPCLTNAYWETFATRPAADLARMLRFVKQHPYAGGLPSVRQLSTDDKLALEEANIVSCLTYSKEKLGLA